MSTEISQFITFKLGNELFAIPVDQVREVLELSIITSVPTARPYMRGVVNVRGRAIPVVDLKLRFGLPAAPDTLNTRIIVLELFLDGETAVLGGVADSVHEVVEIDPASVDPPPRIATRWRAEFIKGMCSRGNDFIVMLDVNAVFNTDESGLVVGAAVESPETVAV